MHKLRAKLRKIDDMTKQNYKKREKRVISICKCILCNKNPNC